MASPSSESFGKFLRKIQPQQHFRQLRGRGFTDSSSSLSSCSSTICVSGPPTSTHSAVPVACDYSRSSAIPASTAPASFSSQRRVLTLRRGEDCGSTAGISDISLPSSWPGHLPALPPLTLSSVTRLALRPARLRPVAPGGRGNIRTNRDFLLSAAATGLLCLTAAAAVTSELPPVL